MTLTEAAKELGLSITAFKTVCRKMGIEKWPRSEIMSHSSGVFVFRDEWVTTEPNFDIDGDDFWLNDNCYRYQHYEEYWCMVGEESCLKTSP